jgi:ribulose-phosphate 3-epimerase
MWRVMGAVTVLPAIIAEDQAQLDERLGMVTGFAGHVMLDVMDGIFVPGTSLDFDYTLPAGPRYQAHLMAVGPSRHMDRLVGVADSAVIHVEAVEAVPEAVAGARDRGLGAFLAVNPDTPVDAVAPYLAGLDGVLVMTVQPGRYGSSFLPRCLGKVEALRAMDSELVVEVDGGMNPETAALAVEMGADVVAVGSYILDSGDLSKAYKGIVDAVQAASPRVRGT